MLVSRHFRLGKLKMLGFLNELDVVSGEAMSLCLPPGLPLPEIHNLLEKALVPQAVIPDIVGLAEGSATGAVLYWGSSRRCLIQPPFPITEKFIATGYDVEPLRSLLERDFNIALVLVRIGAYAIGICQGENLVASKTGTGLVHARHKKGGSSQGRFARHREMQMDHFLKRVCGHIQQQLEQRASSIDYLVYGGARTTILSLRKHCPFMRQFDHHTLPPLLSIPEPRRKVLEAAIADVWSSNITEWYESEATNIDSAQAEV